MEKHQQNTIYKGLRIQTSPRKCVINNPILKIGTVHFKKQQQKHEQIYFGY